MVFGRVACSPIIDNATGSTLDVRVVASGGERHFAMQPYETVLLGTPGSCIFVELSVTSLVSGKSISFDRPVVQRMTRAAHFLQPMWVVHDDRIELVEGFDPPHEKDRARFRHIP